MAYVKGVLRLVIYCRQQVSDKNLLIVFERLGQVCVVADSWEGLFLC